MKNPIAVIGIDTHEGAVWVAVGRKIHSGPTGVTTAYCTFKNYVLLRSDSNVDIGRRQRFIQRSNRAQVALLERGR